MKKLSENDFIDMLALLDFTYEPNEHPFCVTVSRPPSSGASAGASVELLRAVGLRVQRPSKAHGTFKADAGQLVVAELEHLIRNIMTGNPLPQVELERLLDGLSSVIKRQVQSTDIAQQWFSSAAQVVVALIWGFSWQPKVHKKIIKVMVEMERYAGTLIEELLNPWTSLFTQTTAHKDDLITWYGLMEVSSIAWKVVGRNLKAVIVLLNASLGDLLKGDDAWTMERQEWLLLLLKMTLQLFQQLPAEVRLLAYDTEHSADTEFESLVSYVIRLLASAGMPAQCMPLAGTAIAFLVCLCPDRCQGAEVFVDIFIKLGSTEVIRFGSVAIRATPLNNSVPPDGSTSCGFTSFGHLSLLTGLLPCAKPDMLRHIVSINDMTPKILFATWLFDLVVDLCGVPEHQYHSFRLLTAWYQHVAQYATRPGAGDEQIFSVHSPVVVRTLSLVWTHMDSPVDGVNELIIEAFQAMLKLHCAEEVLIQQHMECDISTDSGGGTGRLRLLPLLDEVLLQTLALPWSVKGKHHLVAALVPYIDVTTFIEKETDLFLELLSCCSTNYLGPPSAVLYRALLHRLTENNCLAGFRKYLLPWLAKGLTGESSLLRQNVSQYWLVATLKHNKNTYPLIFEYIRSLQDGQAKCYQTGNHGAASCHVVHALVTVMKAGKAQQLLSNEWEEVVQQALRHQDDNIRLDAFAILCVSQKKAEPLSTGELKLLRTCLPDNMTSDSAPFRQRMRASLRAMLARLRDSAIASLRTKSASSAQVPAPVIDSLDFIDWFWALLMKCLSPGASYQRLKSALDWALLVLDTFSYQPHRHQRKGTTPDAVHHLLAVAVSRGQCDFYSPTNTRLMLTCLLHGTDEIREITGSILLNYFPWPLQLTPCCPVIPTDGEGVQQPSHSKNQEVASPSENRDVMPPNANPDVVRPSENQDVAIPNSNGDVATPSVNRDVVTLNANRDVVPLSENQDVATPNTNRGVAPPNANRDVAPPSKNQDVVTPNINRDVASLSVNRDVVTPNANQDVPPSETRDVVSPSEASEYHLLQTGLSLCNSGKPHQSESGALLIKMIFQKNVVEQKREINFHLLDKGVAEKLPSAEECEDPETAARHFICYLVALVETSLVNTQRDTLQGARTTPMHGLLLAMRRCLGEVGLTYARPAPWAPIIARLLSCVSHVIDVVMDVLGGRLHEDDTAPSFEEMGMAITATIAEYTGDETAHNALLTSDHRLLMTWSWVNIKESSLLLGSLVEALSLTTPSAPGVLSADQVSSIGHVFLKVLLQCRHRGAIEGCNVGFACFCEELLRSSNQQLHAIPKELLSQVLSKIQRSDVALSVTRRSAGLPLIITSIITSESKTRQDVLLCHVIEMLLCVAETPVPEADQRADLPAVHALNVLKSVLKEAAVATAARCYLARALIITIEGFASPHWAIQNAATQLFGILLSRMLGQKRTHKDHVDLMTLPEFLAHYPPLEVFLLRHLERGATDQHAAGQGSLLPQPTTFPVLSILARLSAGNLTHGQYQTSICKFHTALTQLLGCPVYAVRELAALSMASLTPSDQCLPILCRVLDQLPADYSHITQHNRLHGELVLCNLLLRNVIPSTNNQDLLEILALLTNKLWLVSGPSSLVRARYVNLLLEMTRLLRLHGVDDIPDAISVCLQRNMHLVLHQENVSIAEKVGWDQVVRPLVTWFLSPEWALGGAQFVTRVKQCLACTDADVVLTALQAVAEQMSTAPLSEDTWAETQVMVGQLALSTPHCSVSAAALELLAHTGTRLEDMGADPGVKWDLLMEMIHREKNSRQAGPALLLTATLIATDIQTHNSCRLSSWGELLIGCCAPQNAQWLHLHAAKALTTLAPHLATYMNQPSPDPALSGLTIRIFEAGVRLLVSEHVPVRHEVASFVSILQSGIQHISHTQPLHTALALQVLCEVTFASLAGDPALFPQLIALIRKPGRSLSLLVAQEAKQQVDDLFEAEDANYYREDVTLAHMFCSCLQTNMEPVDESFIQALLVCILDDLEAALPSLCDLCSGCGPVNVSCVPRVYEVLWADLMIVALLVRAPCTSHCQPHRLTHLMNQYAKIPFLHPHLQSTAQNLATEGNSVEIIEGPSNEISKD